jgi:5-methylcytosine-specific restriction endonuclease McrA
MGFQKGNKLGQSNKGKKRTSEVREKMRVRKIEFYERNGNTIGWAKGNKLWDNPKVKANQFKKGHKESIETKIKRVKKLSGENQWNWKGGITPLNMQVRGCFKTRQWRSDVFQRDDYTCQFCGLRGVYLEADHYPKLFYLIMQENNIKTLDEALNCEELWNINNGRTLCRKCHDKTKIYARRKKED